MSELDAVRKIDEVIVGAGGQPNIQFSNIDQKYRHLILMGAVGSDAAVTYSGIAIQFNGDTGANYSWQVGYAAASTAGANRSTGQTSTQPFNITTNSIDSLFFTPFTIQLQNYSATTNRKVGLADSAYSDGGFQREFCALEWSSTAAITSILLFCTAGNFRQYSEVSLYGVL